jgi:hypothetical protein
MWIDAGRIRLVRTMRLYLLTRCSFGVLDAVIGIAQFGAFVQFLFWLGLAGYGVARGAQSLVRVLRRPM